MAKKSNNTNKSKKKSQNNSLIKRVLIIIFGITAVVCVVGGIFAYALFSSNINIEKDKKEFLLVYENDCYDDIIDKLVSKQIVKSKKTFKIASWLLNNKKQFKSGRYQITSEMNNLTLVRNIMYGRQTPISISFNNVRTKDVLAERLTKKLKISEEEFLAELYSEQTLKTLGFNKNTVVSLFIPNTYEVYWDITAEELIERMKKEYDLFWNEERTAKLLDVGLSKEEVSTLASIVEEETRKKDEQPVVAGL